jgi:chorismate mutase
MKAGHFVDDDHTGALPAPVHRPRPSSVVEFEGGVVRKGCRVIHIDFPLRRPRPSLTILVPIGIGFEVSRMPEAAYPELQRLRDSIDNIDAAVVHLLAERFKFTEAVGEFKASRGLPPADPAREAEQIARLRALAEAAKLDPNFAEKFLAFIVREVIRHHEAVRSTATDP